MPRPSSVEKQNSETTKQINWWFYAARILPFAALAVLILCILFEVSGILNIVYLILAIFFIIGVTWWYWAMLKIKSMSDGITRALKNLKTFKTEVSKLKDDLRNR